MVNNTRIITDNPGIEIYMIKYNKIFIFRICSSYWWMAIDT